MDARSVGIRETLRSGFRPTKAAFVRIITINTYFSNVHIYAILSDDRINNRAVNTLITKIAEEWVMINSRGF